MLRVLALCSLLCLGSAVSVLKLPEGYSQKLKVVGAAQNLLKDLLLVKEYNVLEGDVHYLVLLGAVYYPAYVLYNSGCYRPNPEQLYRDYLANDLPKVLLNPNKAVNDLQEVVDKTVLKLNALLVLAAKVCDDVSEYECDKLLQKLLESGEYPEAVAAAVVLNDVADVGSVLVSRDKRLKEVAYSLDVLPYLLGNLKDGVEMVEGLASLLKKVLDDGPVTLTAC